jgi:hypothetical protein
MIESLIEALGTIALLLIILIIGSHILKKNEDPKLEEIKNTNQVNLIKKDTNHEIFKEYQWIVEKIFNIKQEYSHKEFLLELQSYNRNFSEVLLLSRFYESGLIDIVRSNADIIYKKGKGYSVPENIFPEIIEVLKLLRFKHKFYNPSNQSNVLQCRLLINKDLTKYHAGTLTFGIYKGQYISEKLCNYPTLKQDDIYYIIYGKIDPNYEYLLNTSFKKAINGTYISEPVLLNQSLLDDEFFLDSLDKYIKDLGFFDFQISGYKM